MKKFFAICVILSIFIACSQNDKSVVSSGVVTDYGVLSFDTEEDFAVYFLNKYYEYFDKNVAFDIAKFVTPEILPLMQIKIEMWHKHMRRFNIVYHNYKLDIRKLRNDKNSNVSNEKCMFFQVVRYDVCENGKSGDSIVIEMKVESLYGGGYRLSDWYTEFDSSSPLVDGWYREALRSGSDLEDVVERYRNWCENSNNVLEGFLKLRKGDIADGSLLSTY